MAAGGKGVPKNVGSIFTVVAVALLGGAGWTGNQQYTILKSWPSVEAEVVSSDVVRYRDSQKTMYRAAVVFRYTVDGKGYTTPASSTVSTSIYSQMKRKVDTYARGTRHTVRYNPADPSDIRFDVGYKLSFFFFPVLLGGMGLVFGAIGVALLYSARGARPLLCRACGQPVEKDHNFFPSCSAPVAPIEPR